MFQKRQSEDGRGPWAGNHCSAQSPLPGACPQTSRGAQAARSLRPAPPRPHSGLLPPPRPRPQLL